MVYKLLRENLTLLEHDLKDMVTVSTKMLQIISSDMEANKYKRYREIRKMSSNVSAIGEHLTTDAIFIIAKFEPKASDLRAIIAMMQMTLDLIRIGEHCRKFYQRMMEVEVPFSNIQKNAIIKMSDTSVNMLELVIESFVDWTPKLAKQVITMDDEMDNLRKMLIHDAFTSLTAEGVKKTLSDYQDFAFFMISSSSRLERIADHCVNMADLTYYAITGRKLDTKI